jgi:hypothetical protein
VRAYATGGASEARPHLEFSLEILLAAVLPAVAGVALTSSYIAGVILGSEFRETAAQIMPILAFAWLFQSISQSYIHASFHLAKTPFMMTTQSIAMLIANLLVMPVLLARFRPRRRGVEPRHRRSFGAAFGWYLTRKAFPLPFNAFQLLRIVLATAIMALVLTFLKPLLPVGRGLVRPCWPRAAALSTSRPPSCSTSPACAKAVIAYGARRKSPGPRPSRPVPRDYPACRQENHDAASEQKFRRCSRQSTCHLSNQFSFAVELHRQAARGDAPARVPGREFRARLRQQYAVLRRGAGEQIGDCPVCTAILQPRARRRDDELHQRRRNLQGADAAPRPPRTVVARHSRACRPDPGIGRTGELHVPVSPNESEIFRDRRVIFTMSKDNPIEWILDWVRFNRDIHGADAVLIYDNGSSAYDSATLSAALRSVRGIRCSVVMEWPFKYGPQGANSWDHWDSDFCQLGAWEHARWRFLQNARSAMNSDIDELVLSKSGKSVFEAAEQSWTGLVRYRGRWIIGIDDGIRDNMHKAPHRHADFSILMPPDYQFSRLGMRRDANACLPKWTVVPTRCPTRVQWHVHSIFSWWASYFCTRDFSFRHFREIGSNWKYQRTSRVPLDASIHKTDRALMEAFQRVDWKN